MFTPEENAFLFVVWIVAILGALCAVAGVVWFYMWAWNKTAHLKELRIVVVLVSMLLGYMMVK